MPKSEQRPRKMYTVEYSWVPTKNEMIMLERYSSIWTEEDWAARQCYSDFHTERCNAIQELVRARIHLALNIYMIHDVDQTFGQVYLAPVAGYQHGIKPTGLADDPLAAKRGTAAKMGKPNKGADIMQMLTAAKERYDAEKVAKAAAVDAAYAEACAAVDAKNAEILEAAQKAWRQAGAPLTMAEKLRGVVKLPQPSWEDWQKTIVFQSHPSRAAFEHEMELKPFLERYKPSLNRWADAWDLTPAQKRERAEEDLAISKGRRAPRVGGRVMEGVWQHWEVAVLEVFIDYRMKMVPY